MCLLTSLQVGWEAQVTWVWPDDMGTSAVKGRRHSLGGIKLGSWGAGEGGPAVRTEGVLLGWAF